MTSGDARGVAPAPPTEDAIRTRLDAATPGPWHLCKHLRSAADDASCRCGYRGSIWGSDQEAVVCEMGAHDPEEMLARYTRPLELANAAFIANAPNDIAWVLSALSAARTRETELEAERDNWKVGYTQMLENARAARREALEEAAKMADETADTLRFCGAKADEQQNRTGAFNCYMKAVELEVFADNVRALAGER